MHLIFFTHPAFLASQSMPRFAAMLTEGMKQKGHTVDIWSPQPQFYKLPVPSFFKKWLGYIDQYVLFPKQVRKIAKQTPPDTLFVFTDQALGPWVPLVKMKPHVIHCHDFLAQRSALGEIPENPTGKTGQSYQAFIRKGYRQGKNFISVSQKTKEDLHRFLLEPPHISEVVYNGMNQQMQPTEIVTARNTLQAETGIQVKDGFILHVGGNQWYKNRKGVIELYTAWRSNYPASTLPLLLIGVAPANAIQEAANGSPYKNDIHFLTGKTDGFVRLAYSGANVFLYPSLAEGFGWPIAEAMAAGCLVVTTGEAPMTEVGGEAAFYIEKMPADDTERKTWARQAAAQLQSTLTLGETEKTFSIAKGLANAERFDTYNTVEKIEAIYRRALQEIK